MSAKKQTVAISDWLSSTLVRTARAHFLYVAAYAAMIIVYDAWDIYIPNVVFKHWLANGALLVIVSIVWYLAHNRNNSLATLKRLTFALITADIVVAAVNIYLQRGMASRAIILFAIPIAVSAITLSRSAIFATAALCVAAYALAAITYFTVYFNEGYKTELYASIGFYSATFFVLAGILSVVVRFGNNASDS